jgi:hypothetical protein
MTLTDIRAVASSLITVVAIFAVPYFVWAAQSA